MLRRKQDGDRMIEVLASVLARQGFLHGMQADQLDALAATASEVVLPAGSRIFADGGQAGEFWLVESGYVVLDVQVPGESPVVIGTVGIGGLLGGSWHDTAAPPPRGRHPKLGLPRPPGFTRHRRGNSVYSTSSKQKKEAVATVAAALLIVAAPPAALSAIQRQPALRARRLRRAATRAARRSQSAT
jgi:hypothetical protein